MLYDGKTGRSRFGGEEILTEWSESPEAWIWVDFDDEDPDREAELFLGRFGLEPLVISDAQRDRHPPKLEAFDGYFFLLLKGLDANTQGIEFGTIQIALFVGERFLVTRRAQESLSTDRAWAEARADDAHLARGPVHMAYRIVRRVTDRYSTIVLALEERLDEVQDEMFEHPRDELLEELAVYSGNLMKLSRIFNYHQGIFEQLSGQGFALVGKRERHEFRDVYEHTERLASLSGLYQELATNLMNVYISVNSHRLNQIMKVLTIVTVVFTPLALLAGIYGMNFEGMPELELKHGYFILLGVMVLIATGLMALFRKLKWM
jgi:magnesium transporter